ncbi:hypothetical protein [Polynucleobacter sp. P1-05-14]|uniref:hypothetical protein n=1 Tax=Polynucleobacter sp. P1-05-14 TaxID=1819732 RepID=UPI001C0BD672|nr:hypothetical protein [Polynucleobacter sp. P1-05-14]MBU3548785.1 hypothetical protein [Polynucleobacter sp. P1-05-14]
MKKQLLAAMLTAVGMVGLTYSQNAMFQAAPEPSVRQQISEAQKQFTNCINQTKKSDAAKVVNNELFEIAPKSDHKMNLFTTENKITDEEAKALMAYLASTNECRAISSHFPVPELAGIYQSFYSQVDVVYQNLLTRKISIGEANKEKYELMQTAQSQWINYESTHKIN